MQIRASVIGASGYTGVELIRLLLNHPHVEITHLVAESNAEQEIGALYPHLFAHISHTLEKLNIPKIGNESDIVFLALPHTKSIRIIEELLSYNCKIIDLSADLRLKNGATYQEWYNHQPTPDYLLNKAVYGLSEINRHKINKASLIANPGCYPTAILLGIAPLLNDKTIMLNESLPIIIDAKSGVSGAGKNPSLQTHFCEVANNFVAYQVGGMHRHIPEIEQEMSIMSGKKLLIQFTPHLIPIPRGLMATIYVKPDCNYGLQEITDKYIGFYDYSEFAIINTQQSRPDLKSVIGTNYCHINLYFDKRTGYLVIISCIDNLIKGASGQAIQNMNIMFNLPEASGLKQIAIYP